MKNWLQKIKDLLEALRNPGRLAPAPVPVPVRSRPVRRR
jgi:hypothetical protein